MLGKANAANSEQGRSTSRASNIVVIAVLYQLASFSSANCRWVRLASKVISALASTAWLPLGAGEPWRANSHICSDIHKVEIGLQQVCAASGLSSTTVLPAVKRTLCLAPPLLQEMKRLRGKLPRKPRRQPRRGRKPSNEMSVVSHRSAFTATMTCRGRQGMQITRQ